MLVNEVSAGDPTPKNFSTGGFYPGAVASTHVAGGTFGIPWYVDTPVLYYRTDLATRAGFTGPPATWDQLKAMATAMRAKAGAKYGIGLAPKDFQAVLPIAWSNGEKLTSADGKKWTIDTPEMVDAVKYYQSFFTAGIANKAPSNDTGYFVVFGIPLTMAVSLALAVALNGGITRFRTFFRVGFYTPVVTSIVAVAVVWRFTFQPNGLLNHVLGGIGIHGPDGLHSTTWAMPALIIMAVWRNMGTLMIIFLAGLQNVSQDVHEAAMVDGASAWQRFSRITLPLLRPTLLLGAILVSVGYLQFFEEPYVMTQGGPLDSTLSITTVIAQRNAGDQALGLNLDYLEVS